MNELDVTLTDYLLAVECGIFWKLLSSLSDKHLRGAFRWFFALLALSALLGGTSHGFFEDESTKLYRFIWAATLASLGLVALAETNAATLLWSGEGKRGAYSPVVIVAAGLVAVYIVYVFSGNRAFRAAIFVYVPATTFLLSGFLRAYFRDRKRSWLLGAFGVLLTFVAALTQQLGIGLHARFFDHNALYHLIQGVALFLIFRAVIVASPQGRAPQPPVVLESHREAPSIS